MDTSKFNMDNYQAYKKKYKVEHMALHREDRLSHGAEDSTENEEEETQLLPEDQVQLDDHFGNYPPPRECRYGFKNEGGLTNAVSSINQYKRPAAVMVTHSAKRDSRRFTMYEQRIRVCLFVSEVFDLLFSDPDPDPAGYENMLMKDKYRVYINGNGEDNFYIKKSALLVEATCDDEGKYFQPLLFRKMPCLAQLNIVHFFQLCLIFYAGFLSEPIVFHPSSDNTMNHGNCYRGLRF
jgi:hypothetical protein